MPQSEIIDHGKQCKIAKSGIHVSILCKHPDVVSRWARAGAERRPADRDFVKVPGVKVPGTEFRICELRTPWARREAAMVAAAAGRMVGGGQQPLAASAETRPLRSGRQAAERWPQPPHQQRPEFESPLAAALWEPPPQPAPAGSSGSRRRRGRSRPRRRRLPLASPRPTRAGGGGGGHSDAESDTGTKTPPEWAAVFVNGRDAEI